MYLTRSEINEALRGATSELVDDLTQEIWGKLDALIPPHASPTIVGVSPHRVQANRLVAGLMNNLGSLRSRRMLTPAVMPRSPFIPRTAQPSYSHVENSTRAELDWLGLTMVEVEPYGSSDLGGDPSDDEPPSMISASPSEDDDPEDPENPSGRKKKKKRKTKRPDGRRSQEAKAITTSKIVMNLPELTGNDLSEFAESEAGLDPRGHLGVTSGVYLWAGKPPLADIILFHPPELTRCDSVIGLAIPATSAHIQYRGAAS